ncbi:MAG: hypothetical protein IBX52_07610 [Bacterioplanes sp.]|nr:hypothetical protein [Bacterioplanes sp.]
MSKQPKQNYVIAHLLVRGSITSWEAITAFRHTRLAHIIYELRNGGANIKTIDEIHHGGKHARYILVNRQTLLDALSPKNKKDICDLLKAANDPNFKQ